MNQAEETISVDRERFKKRTKNELTVSKLLSLESRGRTIEKIG